MNKAVSLIKQVGKSFVDLIYPPLCMHCNTTLDHEKKLFCQSCLSLMLLIDPKERCPLCFSSDINAHTDKCCRECLKRSSPIDRIAAVFDYEGPAATLIKHFKYGNQPYLAKGAGAYLTAQFVHLNWPMPDFIIPMPMASLRKIERGYNQSALLAQEFGKLLNRPVVEMLTRQGGEFSQAGLNHQQRLLLNGQTFGLKYTEKLYDKNLLLVDDVMTTGSSLKCCAEVLRTLFPAHIYALTVCRAL